MNFASVNFEGNRSGNWYISVITAKGEAVQIQTEGTAWMLRVFILVGVIGSLLGNTWSLASAQEGIPGSTNRISIGPDDAIASFGDTVSYTVTIGTTQSRFSGAALVTIPAGLTVIGQPVCNAGCGQPSVIVGPANTQIETSVNIYAEANSSFSFHIVVDSATTGGTSYQIAAYLLGGVNTAGSSETAYATLTVADTAASGGPALDRGVSLSITPLLLRAAPGGSTLYFMQPLFWGDWSGSLPDYTVEVDIPSGVILPQEPICGPRLSVMPNANACPVRVEDQDDGIKLLTANPGFVESGPNGIYMSAQIGSDVLVGTTLQLQFSLLIDGSVQREESAQVITVEATELSSHDAPGTVSGVLELDADSFAQPDICGDGYISGGTELAIYEWGGTNMLASTIVSAGRFSEASDGTGRNVCIFSYTFEDVPGYSVYLVSLKPLDGDAPCRACVLGLVTPSELAVQVTVQTQGEPT